MTRAMAVNLAPHGIRVCPRRQRARAPVRKWVAGVHANANGIPLGRVGEPEDIAQRLHFSARTMRDLSLAKICGCTGAPSPRGALRQSFRFDKLENGAVATPLSGWLVRFYELIGSIGRVATRAVRSRSTGMSSARFEFVASGCQCVLLQTNTLSMENAFDDLRPLRVWSRAPSSD